MIEKVYISKGNQNYTEYQNPFTEERIIIIKILKKLYNYSRGMKKS